MEQEVATQLEALGFHVSTNQAFKDVEEGKSREIDITAIKRVAHNEKERLSAFVEIIAECKNNKNPFVFIGRPKNRADEEYAPQEFVFPILEYMARERRGDSWVQFSRKPFFHLGFDKVHYDFTNQTKAVQFCRIDRKGNRWEANHGGLYDSIFYPMAKAVTARKQTIPHPRHADDWRFFWLFVPIVVTSGDIFYIDSMERDPGPEPRSHVTFKREVRSEKLNGIFAVDFVRQDKVEKFISDLDPLVVKLTDLTMDKAEFVLKSSL